MAMIESAVNTVQLIVTFVCASYAFVRAAVSHKRSWFLLGLFLGAAFLGDLYWGLFLLFYGDTPNYAYISALNWYAMFMFLMLLFTELEGRKIEWSRRWTMWFIPLFTAGMCVYYMQWGAWLDNIATAACMTVLLWRAVDGIVHVRGKKGEESRNRAYYLAVLLFCFAEYCLWTASCLWEGDTFANPYMWFDILLTLSFAVFPFALRKAVDA